jgi:hypothetical protein
MMMMMMIMIMMMMMMMTTTTATTLDVRENRIIMWICQEKVSSGSDKRNPWTRAAEIKAACCQSITGRPFFLALSLSFIHLSFWPLTSSTSFLRAATSLLWTASA